MSAAAPISNSRGREAHISPSSPSETGSPSGSEDFLHRASKQLIAEAVADGCTTIVFEDLEGIRERISDASKFQQCVFRELRRQTEYKAQAEGIVVETVNPAYTSQRCNHTECGFIHEDNRDGDEFCRQKCGSSYTPTTTRRATSHTSISRIGASLVLEGRPITLP